MPELPTITRDQVLAALKQLDRGVEHPFGEATKYMLLHDGKQYAPKAVLRLAAGLAAGHEYGPDEFSGGEDHANPRLRRLGFTVVGKGDDPVGAEQQRREEMWRGYSELTEGQRTPKALERLGIRPAQTGQGVFRDLDNTRGLAPPQGVTLSLLDLGAKYADTFDDEGGIYFYPDTGRGGRDQGEIEATKNAHRLGLPVFVVMSGEQSHLRDVRRGWVVDWNDAAGRFYISFEPLDHVAPQPDEPFNLKDHKPKRTKPSETVQRPGQARFRFAVEQRYGLQCAACELAVAELLEAAHICPFAEGGSDDPRNGLLLCRNHHRALDAGLFAVNPETGELVAQGDGPDLDSLGVARSSLAHLPAQPHGEALRWRWERFG